MKKIFLYLFLFLTQSSLGQNWEVSLLNSINTPKIQPNADKIFRGTSSSSYILSVVAPVSVFAAGLVKKDKTFINKSLQMATGLGLSMSMSMLLKYSINRERPSEKYAFIFPKLIKDSPSFPSGHATAAFETATSLSLNFPKWYVIVPTYIWAGAVGYSRMYMGVHYPSDVAAGMLIGMGSAWLTWKINKRCQKRKAK